MTGQTHFLEAWYFPLQGWRYFSVYGLDYFFGTRWAVYACGDSMFCQGLSLVTGLALPFFILGVGVVAWSAVQGQSRNNESLRQRVDALAFGVLLFSILFNGMLQTYGHPHYYNALWVVLFYLLWRGTAALTSRFPRLGFVVVGTYSVAMMLALVLTVFAVHRHGGSRVRTFGTTLSEQLRIAQQLKNWSPDALVKVRVEGVPMDFLPFRVLCEVNRWSGTEGGRTTTPVVSYREGQGPLDAWLQIQ
jgi:hypothetical protein